MNQILDHRHYIVANKNNPGNTRQYRTLTLPIQIVIPVQDQNKRTVHSNNNKINKQTIM